jgi:hypothetical protein
MTRNAESWAACGVAFSAPRDGRLQISAVLRNFYNKLMYSVTDNWGFSSADVGISVELFVVVVRGTKGDLHADVLRTTGLVSHGSDLSFSESEIDDTTPFTITATTDERFDANESGPRAGRVEGRHRHKARRHALQGRCRALVGPSETHDRHRRRHLHLTGHVDRCP